MNSDKKGQSLIHTTENLLDTRPIFDYFDCPLFDAERIKRISKKKYNIIIYTKTDEIIDWRKQIHGLIYFGHLEACDSVNVIDIV